MKYVGKGVRDRRAAVVFTAVSLVLCFVVTSFSAERADFLGEPIDLFTPALKAAAAPCSLHNNNSTAFAYLSTIRPQDRFASYLNPVNCTGTEDLPMAIYWVSLPLYHFAGVHWPVGATIEVYQKSGVDSCAGPGDLLYSYATMLDSATFAAPHVGVITLPDPVCVTGPFYVAIEFNGTTPQPYPSVLFDGQMPANPCLNWVYRDGWAPWNLFWTPPGAGNFMIWVDGYSNSETCAADEPEIQSINSLYANWPTLIGTKVTTVAYFTDSSDAKLVDNYGAYLANEPMPVRSALELVGPLADSSYRADLCEVTGYLTAERNSTPYYLNDTVTLKLYPSKWTRIMLAPSYPGADPGPDLGYPTDPDTNLGTFALLMGGGVDETNDHARYWNELAKEYEFAIAFPQAIPEHIYVLYGDGISRDVTEIPQAQVDSLTAGEATSALNGIAHGMAMQAGIGGRMNVHIYVGGQGGAQGILTLGGQALTAAQFRAGVQSIIDSGCTELYIDFSTAFAGPLGDSLKLLDNRGRTIIRFGSASGGGLSYSSPLLSAYIRTRLDSLAAGQPYGVVQPDAGFDYVLFLNSLSESFSRFNDSCRSWLLAHAPGSVSDSIRSKVVNDSLVMTGRRAALNSTISSSAGRPRMWLQVTMNGFGYSQPIDAPPSGQLVVTFTGDTLFSGDVSVYKDTLDGAVWRDHKAAVWKLNIPGSKGYQAGNERRVINAENAAATTYWLRNDSRRFDITADILTDQPNAESGSNPYHGAGFSLGIYNLSNGEFGSVLHWPVHEIHNPEIPGVFVDTFPRNIPGPSIIAYYDIPTQNQFWTDMELWVAISKVTTPGPLNMTVSGADVENFAIPITGPGVYTFPVGSISGTGQHLVGFWPTSGAFEFDSWALRSRISDPATCCIGTTGNVNETGIVDLSDLSVLVGYLTGVYPLLPCSEEANVNGLGIVDLTDLSILVSYLTGGGAALPSCP